MGLALILGIASLIMGVVWWIRYPELRLPHVRKRWPFGFGFSMSAVWFFGFGVLALTLYTVDRLTG
jgi:hypothetical protein